MTSIISFPKLGRTFTDIIEDELYHMPHPQGPVCTAGTPAKSNSFMFAPPTVTSNPPNSPHPTAAAPLNWSSFLHSMSDGSTVEQFQTYLNQQPPQQQQYYDIPDTGVNPFNTYADPNVINQPQSIQPGLFTSMAPEETPALLKCPEELLSFQNTSVTSFSLTQPDEPLFVWPHEVETNRGDAHELFEEELSDCEEDVYFDDDVMMDDGYDTSDDALTGVAHSNDETVDDSFCASKANHDVEPVFASLASQRTYGAQLPSPVLSNNTSPTMAKLHTVQPVTPASFSAPSDAAEPEVYQCTSVNPATGLPCLKQFSRPYDLVRHQDTIHAEKKKIFRCVLCDKTKTFSRGDALSRHIRVKHGLQGEDAVRAINYAKDHVEFVLV